MDTSLTFDRELELISLGAEIGRAATFVEACALATRRLASLTGAACAIRARNGTEWHTIAHDGTRVGDCPDDAAITIPLHDLSASAELQIARPESSDRDLSSSISLNIADDPVWRDAVGDVLSGALQLVTARAERVAADHHVATLQRFARTLLGIADSPSLHRAIVGGMAHAVRADVGAFAVYSPQENALAITATYGYPSVLVEHVRISPGEGVLGRVFESGEPVLAASAGVGSRQPARRRYRTDSYVALPLAGPDGVVAVVSLTDKVNGAFSVADLALLQEMLPLAALAVSRELLRDRTNDLAHLATVDSLTGLFNRRYFETRLEQELQRQRRQFEELSLLMLDLDNFKELNDTQGHLVGDLALKEVAEILRRAVRIFDVCARYGGEEFVILMPGAASATALRIAERIRRQVEQHFATGRRSGVPVPLTVSIGVSTASLSVTRDALVAQADSALLRAKATGKNQVNLHQDGAPDPPPA